MCAHHTLTLPASQPDLDETNDPEGREGGAYQKPPHEGVPGRGGKGLST